MTSHAWLTRHSGKQQPEAHDDGTQHSMVTERFVVLPVRFLTVFGAIAWFFVNVAFLGAWVEKRSIMFERVRKYSHRDKILPVSASITQQTAAHRQRFGFFNLFTSIFSFSRVISASLVFIAFCTVTAHFYRDSKAQVPSLKKE